MVWERKADSEPGFPHVWARFKGPRPLPDGRTVSYKIQDVTKDMYPAIVEFMKANFLREEPCSKSISLASDQESVESFHKIWEECLDHSITLVCLIDDPEDKNSSEIVGVNILYTATKTNKFNSSGETCKKVVSLVGIVDSAVDVYKKYGVDRYIAGLGLSVNKNYRGQNIGLELLKARVPLGKALGFGLTVTVFTAIESQKCAEKAGFHTVFEISYEDVEKKHGLTFPNMNVKICKNMALVIE